MPNFGHLLDFVIWSNGRVFFSINYSLSFQKNIDNLKKFQVDFSTKTVISAMTSFF